MNMELVGIVDAREWCNGCLTSAMLSGKVYQLTPDGVWSVGTFRRCQRCKQEERP